MIIDFTTAVPTVTIASTTVSFLYSISPYLELIIGILLAFFVIGAIISQAHGASPDQIQRYNKKRQEEIDYYNDDDYEIL